MARKGENIYKRKDGRWEGRYKSGFNDSGKSKYRSLYGKSYKDVKDKLIICKSKTENYVSSGSLRVKELSDEWLSAVKIRAKESTYVTYRMKLEKHIIPAFGGLRYECLTAKMLYDFIDEKIKSGLSPKYVSDIVIVLKSVAKYASKTYGFANMIADVVLPKSEKQELKLYNENQQKQLCNYLMCNMNNTSLCILLSMYTGMRIGEVCGLKWSDINFETSILTVRRTVQRISCDKGTKLLIGTPKSRSSLRTIPLPNFIMNLLKKFKSCPDNYILSGTNKVTEPRTLQYRFKAILKRVNLPSINFHVLRHMFATNCIKLGFDVKTLSEILGHSSVEITLNIYVKSSMERKIECMNLLKPAA